MSLSIEPDPSELEREAILAALASRDAAGLGEWAQAALAEGVEIEEADP
jgi:hypothetical protein